jgi:hypothetical protein
MTRRSRVAAAALAIAVSIFSASGCSEDDPREALDDARYELTDAVDFWVWAPRRDLDPDWEPPSGVEALGGGGSTDPRDATGDTSDPHDLDLENAARVHADQSGDIWVLTYGTVVHIVDGHVDDIYDIGAGPEAISAITVDPEGRLAATNVTSIITFEPGEAEPRVITDRFGGIRANAIAYQADGTLLAGGYLGDRLVAVTDDGEKSDVLDLPDDPGTVLGPIGFVTVLPDGRIAVASWATEDGLDLSVVADRAVRPIGEGADQPRPPEPITSLAPAPDGRLLVTSPDRIDAVDVDTGESDTLVALDGAEGTPSAAASGDDLIFLADGRLWRLPDAFG